MTYFVKLKWLLKRMSYAKAECASNHDAKELRLQTVPITTI
jgi:hypothetical protein